MAIKVKEKERQTKKHGKNYPCKAPLSELQPTARIVRYSEAFQLIWKSAAVGFLKNKTQLGSYLSWEDVQACLLRQEASF